MNTHAPHCSFNNSPQLSNRRHISVEFPTCMTKKEFPIFITCLMAKSSQCWRLHIFLDAISIVSNQQLYFHKSQQPFMPSPPNSCLIHWNAYRVVSNIGGQRHNHKEVVYPDHMSERTLSQILYTFVGKYDLLLLFMHMIGFNRSCFR